MSGADFSLTTFSPSGKLVQIEYALNAVNAGKTSIGIKGQQPAAAASRSPQQIEGGVGAEHLDATG